MKPMCRLCGVAHFAREPHEFQKEVVEPSELCRPVQKKVVVHAVANPIKKVANAVANKTEVAPKSRGGDRHKDVEGRRAYQRELMRKRRAAKRASGVSA